MNDTNRRERIKAEKERLKRRIRVAVDPNKYEYIPEKKPFDVFEDIDTHQRVGIYARVSTDNLEQTSSYELQKKYYEEFVTKHPNWKLVEIYADEGISGTFLRKRKNFLRMIEDAKAGKLDLIVTKSVSRFARNVEDFLGTIRELTHLKNPVGVLFEMEMIFSLKDESKMALSFHATMAEEESHVRSRSMETSLRMRLDNGLPLTPKLYGYTHDAEGNLVINPEEAPTVKLMFYMYLYGFSSQQIADELNKLEKKTYYGKGGWLSSVVLGILRNERHCGDVLTRKTYTPDFHDHISRPNRGDRPQSRYYDHHESIVSRDDYIAVQHMIQNARFRNKSVLPELSVIEDGILKGFVVIHPRWAAFKEAEYMQAARSVPKSSEQDEPRVITVNPGDFDYRGFEIARSELLDTNDRPAITFSKGKIKLNVPIIRKYGEDNYLELLINPLEGKFAVRRSDKDNRSAVQVSLLRNGQYYPKPISATAFYSTVFGLFDWDTEIGYRIIGSLFEQDGESVYIFNRSDSQALMHMETMTALDDSGSEKSDLSLSSQGRNVRAIQAEWFTSFGKEFYFHEQTLIELESQSERDWKLRMEGTTFSAGKKLNVTGFDELKAYIWKELGKEI